MRPRPPVVRYVGFEITAEGREYSLLVTSDLPPRSFVLLVTHQAFASRLTRYQDAPDLCFRRLARELERDPALAPGDRLCFTTDDLLDYQSANAPGAAKRKRPASAVPAP